MVLSACRAPAPGADTTADASTSKTPVATAWTLPAPAGSAQPDLMATPDGALLLSWVEPAGEGRHRLQFARHANGSTANTWNVPQTIAEGDDWFLNWADTPHVIALQDGSLWAHWLRSTGPGRMDYGIDLVRSGDGGAQWTKPQLVHPSGTPGDHGFVTFWPHARDRLGIAWLDSRQKAADAHGGHDAHASHDHGGGAPMMLRAALYDAAATQQGEWPLDASTCDCCTTSSAMTDRGVVVVYRGRTDEEIRDTRLVRFDGTAWTAPRDVHADGWKIAGCPVNGPVVVARGNVVWTAWYTEAAGVPELRAARSDDAGDRFSAPVTLARGTQVMGRLSLALGGDQLHAAWLEQGDDETQHLVMQRHDLQWQHAERVDVARLSARGRASGMPRMAYADGAAWMVWTDVQDGGPVVRGASVR